MDGFRAVSRWIAWLEGSRGVRPRTVEIYRAHVTKFLASCVGGHPSRATEKHISSYLRAVGKNGPHGRAQAASSLRSAYGYWKRHRIVRHDPTVDLAVKKPRQKEPVALPYDLLLRYLIAAYWSGREGGRANGLSEAEARNKGERRALAFLLCFSIGTRRTELANIAPADVMENAVKLRVTKGGRERDVDVGTTARMAVEGLRPYMNGTVLGGIKPGTLNNWAKQAADAAGIYPLVQGRTLHVLRASFITHLLRNGANPIAVKNLAGHRSLATTTIYGAALDGDGQDAVACLEGLGA